MISRIHPFFACQDVLMKLSQHTFKYNATVLEYPFLLPMVGNRKKCLAFDLHLNVTNTILKFDCFSLLSRLHAII